MKLAYLFLALCGVSACVDDATEIVDTPDAEQPLCAREVATDGEAVFVEHFVYEEGRLVRTESDQDADGSVDWVSVRVYDDLGRVVRIETGPPSGPPVQIVDQFYSCEP